MSDLEQTPSNILRNYRITFFLLLFLFVLVIGGGGSWLYLSARHAQTKLVTDHILNVARPIIKQIKAEQSTHSNYPDRSTLSEKVITLHDIIPHLKQISIRSNHKGFGIRLDHNQQLVDIELEPLLPDKIPEANQLSLARQLHIEEDPLFHVLFDLSMSNTPVEIDIAFDRLGLIRQIESSLQSLIRSIILYSGLCLISLLIAVTLFIYMSIVSSRASNRLQIIFQRAEMGKLSADLVHDLRNPLASIRANIKNLIITPEQTDQVVAEMDQDLMRLEQKLTHFLKLTKPNNNAFTTVDVGSFLQDVVRQCYPLFKEKLQSLNVNVNPGNIQLSAMTDSLSDALINLLTNAHNNTPEHGNILLIANDLGSQLEILVEDDGPGIKTDNLPRIFEPFFTTRNDGHGLGLAIAKRIVEAHQGAISAHNRSKGGACFRLTLPKKREHDRSPL